MDLQQQANKYETENISNQVPALFFSFNQYNYTNEYLILKLQIMAVSATVDDFNNLFSFKCSRHCIFHQFIKQNTFYELLQANNIRFKCNSIVYIMCIKYHHDCLRYLSLTVNILIVILMHQPHYISPFLFEFKNLVTLLKYHYLK